MHVQPFAGVKHYEAKNMVKNDVGPDFQLLSAHDWLWMGLSLSK